MKILVTGGAGYIGSHTCVSLLECNYDIVVIDNFFNSKKEVIDNIKKITNKEFKFYEGDICNKELLEKIFTENKIDAVIHFAAYKAVAESVEKPLMYYRNNLLGTINLCEVMQEYNCKKIIFSSSATVYGNPSVLPITEENEIGNITNPYGATKFFIERILQDIYISDNSWSITLLRYFNPLGAHRSGLIGENPNGIPNNLMPYILRVAKGESEYLNVYGNDYDTIDGTGVRDYIHVLDLATGHIKALNKSLSESGVNIYNLGTGKGYSVLEIVDAFEKNNNIKIPYKIVERRPGDIDACYASIEKAKKELDFTPNYDINDMVKDSYNFINKKNN